MCCAGSFHDMNLVAKEFVAARADGGGGVLIVSRFAGPARQLSGAIVVNPYGIDGVPEVLTAELTRLRDRMGA